MGMVTPEIKIERFGVYLVRLDPAKGKEIKKTRPCVIVSPDETNQHFQTVIVSPMTTKGYPYPTRVKITFQGEDGLILLDQIRAVDKKTRIIKQLGKLTEIQKSRTLAVLQNLFA